MCSGGVDDVQREECECVGLAHGGELELDEFCASVRRGLLRELAVCERVDAVPSAQVRGGELLGGAILVRRHALRHVHLQGGGLLPRRRRGRREGRAARVRRSVAEPAMELQRNEAPERPGFVPDGVGASRSLLVGCVSNRRGAQWRFPERLDVRGQLEPRK